MMLLNNKTKIHDFSYIKIWGCPIISLVACWISIKLAFTSISALTIYSLLRIYVCRSLVLNKTMLSVAFTRFATSSSHLRCNGAYKPCVLRSTAKSSFIWFSVHYTKQYSQRHSSYQTTLSKVLMQLPFCTLYTTAAATSFTTIIYRTKQHITYTR